MNEAKVIVKPGSLRPGSVGPATADICLVVESDSFPMPGWNDFAIVILAAFAEAALRLRSRASTRETVRFMDGPYRVELEASSDRDWTIELVAEDESDTGTRSRIDPDSLIASICCSANELLDACRERQHWTRDEETLQRLLSSLAPARN